ncbi:hypothetical protein RIB2604_02112520 [Aspergillus luchuensis]|uniref:Uncharacterized protein n=1 Tax=Aspergillus kawachii TaxID=1069201 RepID=A0A146FPK3_ASPKA|nr:hypothetical protein RIB2604_02112520 [Aspergillus luchuensis]
MPLARATFNDIVLAESPTWETVEGNIYHTGSDTTESIKVTVE